MAGLSRQWAGWLMAGSIAVGGVAGRWWERRHQVPRPPIMAKASATKPPVEPVRPKAPELPPDFAVVEKALQDLIFLFQNASGAERETEVRRIFSRVSASELRELGGRIVTSTNLASLGRPERTLEEFLFERLGTEFGAGFEDILKLNKERDRRRRDLAITAALDGWISVDLPGAIEHFKQRPLDEMGTFLAGHLAAVWLEKDPAGFFDYMRLLPPRNEGMPVKKRLVEAWARKDHEAAFAWAWNFMEDASYEQSQLVAAAFRGLVRKGMGYAIGVLHSQPDLKERVQLPSAIARSLDPEQANEAMRELLKLPAGPLDWVFVPSQYELFGELDPRLYLRLLLRAGSYGPAPEFVFSTGLGRLAGSDSGQAMALFREIPETVRAKMPRLAGSLVAGMGARDLESSIRFIQQDLNPAERLFACQSAIMGAAMNDPIGALRFVELAAESEKASLWQMWGSVVAQSKPEQLKAYAEFMPPGPAREQAVVTAIATMAATDMAGAGDWAASLLPGASRLEAYRVLSARLAMDSPKVAEQWLRSMPDIPERTAAVAEFVRKTTYKDPETAVRWALTLPDIETNPEPFERPAKYWLQQQRPQATEYFRIHEVPEALRSIVQPKTK